MTKNNLLQWDKNHTWHPWTSTSSNNDTNLILTKGKGCYVESIDGKTYLDATSAALNASCGYSHPKIINKITEQMNQIMHFDFRTASTVPTVTLAKKINDLLPEKLTRTFFCNSGSEAIETVVKMVRGYFNIRGQKEKHHILSLEKGYHGTTLAAASISQMEIVQKGLHPFPNGFEKVQYNSDDTRKQPNAEHLEEKIQELGANNIAAFIVEPILGIGGSIILDTEYLEQVQAICRKHGVLLVFDETMTGFGRTGKMFAFERRNIIPDILVTGKGISGGYFPVSTITTTEEIYSMFEDDDLLQGLRHGHTNSGHATGSAAALATIEVMEEEDLIENSATMGLYLYDLVLDLRKYPIVDNVRGLGLFVAMDTPNDEVAQQLVSLCKERGLIVRQTLNSITLVPPLIINKNQIKQLYSILEGAIKEMSSQLKELV